MGKEIFGVDIDLSNNQLLNATIQNLTEHPSTTNRVAGFIYWNTTVKTAYIFTGVPNTWLDLGAIYTHPTLDAVNPTLSGAKVLATLTTNSDGHIIAVTTRTLLLSDLGYTGSLDANNYVHPSFAGNTLSGAPLTGSVVISNVSTNSEGHVTGFATRSLTPSDLGTLTSQEIVDLINSNNNVVSGGLINKGGYDANANTPLLDATPIAGIKNGWTYIVTTNGLFFSEKVSAGDLIIAKQDNPTLLSHWTVVNKNIDDIIQSSEIAQGIIQLASNAEAITGTNGDKAITPVTLKAVLDSRIGGFAANIGNGSATSFDVIHNLNTIDIIVEIIEVLTGQTVRMQVLRSSVNIVNVQCNTPPTTNQYRVIIKK